MQDTLEQRLLAGYQRQSDMYDRALRVIEQHSGEPNWTLDLNRVLEEVTTLEAELADAKTAWRESGQTPGLELRMLLDRMAGQLRTLQSSIDNQVAEITARKQRLMPEMDEFIRRRWMLNAYGQTPKA